MCYHPLTAYIINEDKLNSIDARFIGSFDYYYLCSFLTKYGNRQIFFTNNRIIPEKFYGFFDEIQVPCGKCLDCKLKRSKQWSARCVHEAQKYTNIKGEVRACFLTLTYDEKHVPTRPVFKKVMPFRGKMKYHRSILYLTGKANYRVVRGRFKSVKTTLPLVRTLKYRDIQLFMKRLRSNLYQEYKKQLKIGIKDPAKRRKFRNNYKNWFKIRFFCSSEYGGKTKRPHYHMILYNFVPRDLTLFKSRETIDGSSYSGMPIYRSKFIEDIWQNGMVFIGTCTQMSAGYVARYTLEKVSEQTDPHFYDFREKEGLRMSRRNGIGYDWITKNLENMFQAGYFILDKIKYGLPRYYRKIMEQLQPEKYKEFKTRLIENAQNVAARFLDMCTRFNVKEYEQRKREELLAQSRVKRLKRRLTDFKFKLPILNC